MNIRKIANVIKFIRDTIYLVIGMLSFSLILHCHECKV